MKKFKRKVLAMLMTNNFGSSLRQQLFDGAPFCSELLYTAIPQRAASGTTATFTRATTKTVENNDGYLVTLLAGEIGFVGARRVYNQVSTKSADNTVGSTINSNVTAATTTLTFTAANNAYWYKNSNGNAIVGRKYVCSATVSSTVARTVCFRALATSGTNSDVQNVALTTASQRIELTFTADIVGVILFGVENRAAYATDTSTTGVITFTDVQLEDVTAQTTQTAGEYVSVGVESAPAYHGSMVDGVKCFPTDLSGNLIPSTTLLGYQAEGARTNLCLQSQDFATTWTVTDATISVNTKVAADGTTTADSLVENAAAATAHVVTQAITKAASSAAYTLSVYVEKGGRDWVALTLFDNTALGARAWFNVNTGVVGSTANIGAGMGTITANIESVGGGIYRCKMSVSASGTATRIDPYIYSTNADAVLSVNGINAVGLYLWGAQVELGSFATSYIATTTVAATRNADVLMYPSSGNFSDTAGWIYSETQTQWSNAASTRFIVSCDNASAYGPLMTTSNLSTQIVTYDASAAATKSGIPDMRDSPRKVAMTFGGGAMSITGGGLQPAATTYDGSFGGGNINVGNHQLGAFGWHGTIRNVRIGQRQLSASEMQAITS